MFNPLFVRARAVLTVTLTKFHARAFLVSGTVVLRINKCVYGHPNRPNTTSSSKNVLFQYGSLGTVERLEHCGQAVITFEILIGRKHIRKGARKYGCRFGMHKRRPADAILDSGALQEDSLSGVDGLAAVQNDQAEVWPMCVDEGRE